MIGDDPRRHRSIKRQGKEMLRSSPRQNQRLVVLETEATVKARRT